jgi:hypothetical protein
MRAVIDMPRRVLGAGPGIRRHDLRRLFLRERAALQATFAAMLASLLSLSGGGFMILVRSRSVLNDGGRLLSGDRLRGTSRLRAAARTAASFALVGRGACIVFCRAHRRRIGLAGLA